MNSLVYLTRQCPRKCDYCRLRDSNLENPELNTEQWLGVFEILHTIGVDFNLILGNETWLLGGNLLEIFQHNKVPYALYTSAPPKLFDKWQGQFFKGRIDNLSCGIDWPISRLKYMSYDLMSDDEKKSYQGWKALMFTRKNFPHVDCQGTITVTRKNYGHLFNTVKELSSIGVNVGINFIHWNKDGGFDFFPEGNEIEDLLLTKDIDHKHFLRQEIHRTITAKGNMIQNREMFINDYGHMLYMDWHCCGNPYGGPTIDADGSLRLCGYRPGKRTSQMTIFDLQKNWGDWQNAIRNDALDCPGCGWSYPWMYKYWTNMEPAFGKKVFTSHAGKHIPKQKWSKRGLE